MKFLKMLCMVGLVGLMSAAAVKADSAPGDPKLFINKPGDPTCTGGVSQDPSAYTCFSVNSAEDPIFIASLNTPATFVWDGTGTLEQLFAFFVKGPIGTPYSCGSVDIFDTAPCVAFSSPDLPGPVETLGFEFFGGPSDNLAPCDANGNCQGVTATLQAPEPNSMLLLFGLGLPALGFARKRWNVRPSA